MRPYKSDVQLFKSAGTGSIKEIPIDSSCLFSSLFAYLQDLLIMNYKPQFRLLCSSSPEFARHPHIIDFQQLENGILHNLSWSRMDHYPH